MLSLLRTRSAIYVSLPSSRYIASRPQAAISFSTAFKPTRSVKVQDKDADPTPDKARGGSEQSMPGEASGDQIANSEGAYDSSTTRPESSGKEIEGEKDVNMKRSAASSKPSQNATDGESKQTTSQGQGGSNPKASGGSAVRGGNAK